jgi:hypothetical protein
MNPIVWGLIFGLNAATVVFSAAAIVLTRIPLGHWAEDALMSRLVEVVAVAVALITFALVQVAA